MYENITHISKTSTAEMILIGKLHDNTSRSLAIRTVGTEQMGLNNPIFVKSKKSTRLVTLSSLFRLPENFVSMFLFSIMQTYSMVTFLVNTTLHDFLMFFFKYNNPVGPEFYKSVNLIMETKFLFFIQF